MSEASDISSEQEKELRRRNVNLGSGDYSDSAINKIQSDENKANADDLDKDLLAENQTIDSDQVRKKVLKKMLKLLIFCSMRRKKVKNKVTLVNWINLFCSSSQLPDFHTY